MEPKVFIDGLEHVVLVRPQRDDIQIVCGRVILSDRLTRHQCARALAQAMASFTTSGGKAFIDRCAHTGDSEIVELQGRRLSFAVKRAMREPYGSYGFDARTGEVWITSGSRQEMLERTVDAMNLAAHSASIATRMLKD